jgi:signal recognition particle receptor subunit beta
VLIDEERRELTVKLVYYGPALSGKTTNLQHLYAQAAPRGRGRLVTLDTHEDRTIFFDLLPLHLDTPGGAVVKLRVYTVPGQVVHNATRKVVLRGADGIVFVADARVSETGAANEAFANLRANLRERGVDPDRVPTVVQWNKSDLPGGRPAEELHSQRDGRLSFPACARDGQGVLAPFLAVARLAWDDLEERHGLEARLGVTAVVFAEALAGLFGKQL